MQNLTDPLTTFFRLCIFVGQPTSLKLAPKSSVWTENNKAALGISIFAPYSAFGSVPVLELSRSVSFVVTLIKQPFLLLPALRTYHFMGICSHERMCTTRSPRPEGVVGFPFVSSQPYGCCKTEPGSSVDQQELLTTAPSLQVLTSSF